MANLAAGGNSYRQTIDNQYVPNPKMADQRMSIRP
jgi:hypothetical protein